MFRELEKKIKDKKAYKPVLKSQISAAAAAAQCVKRQLRHPHRQQPQALAQQQEACRQKPRQEGKRNRRKSRVNIRPHFIHTRRRLFRRTSSSSLDLNAQYNQAQSDYNQADTTYQMAFATWQADPFR